MSAGKKNRLKRIINPRSGKTVIVPMDHGVTMGPIEGLTDIAGTVKMVHQGGANAIVLHKGLVMSCCGIQDKEIGLIVHLSASTEFNPVRNDKVPVCDVEEALTLGGEAVSVHINIGAGTESAMISFLGRTAAACHRWGMPLLAMMYPRGDRVETSTDSVKMAARVGAELGADIVKCPYTGSAKSFEKVVEGCPVPVVIAGGARRSDAETLKMIEGAMKAGAAGISMGRNAFQHARPEAFIRAAGAMVHEGLSADQALALLAGRPDFEASDRKELVHSVSF